jgi:hypothetical protein
MACMPDVLVRDSCFSVSASGYRYSLAIQRTSATRMLCLGFWTEFLGKANTTASDRGYLLQFLAAFA